MQPRFLVRILFALLGSVTCSIAPAEIRLPGFFGDHMVLQQGMPIKVWGWGDQGQTVIVSIGGVAAETEVQKSQRWSIELPALAASKQPHELVVQSNGKTITIKDVLIGEVWLCSGQSNMEWTVQRSLNAAEEIGAGAFPQIRHLKVPRRPSTTPLDDIEAPWEVCSPETVANFTAAGYFMARRLHRELDVPVGLINSSWGGTRVEPWTPPKGFEQVQALGDIFQSIQGRTPGTKQYQERLSQYVDATATWLEQARAALESEQSVAPSPVFPPELDAFKSHQDPTMLYNGMIHALVGYPLRGAIWYQGESNHNEGMLYFEKKKALIEGWRDLWGQGNFPFYYVQIAPFQYGNEDPTILAKFWEAQAAVQQLPQTGMVVINDIATLNDIHPPNKQDVGERLALWALKNEYQKDVVANNPEVESVNASDGQLTITFRHTGGGLKTRDGKAPTHFEVIGPGALGYHPAVAEIQGDRVLLTSEQVPAPTAVRFAWNKLAEPNLMGGTGLPVGAFRGGKEPDLLSQLSIEKNFQLVYELDLNKLAQEFEYDIDRSDEVDSFSRVAYLLELDSQKVFVAMDAFTDNVQQIGIPTLKSGARFQKTVQSMTVFSNVAGVQSNLDGIVGNIEFWPNNYGPQNAAGIPGASNRLYDTGDDPGPPQNGYGCMQVHNHLAGQTVFAINHWNAGANGADLGIGNSTGPQRDWTFSGNGKNIDMKRLRIYVDMP